MAFAGEEAGGGIESDPAGAGEEDFGPGVEICEVGCGTCWSFEGLLVRGELNEVAGDEAGCQAEAAEEMNEQPGGVAAGAGAFLQGFSG